MRQSSIRTLIGLIEERLRSIEVIDREDKREKRLLESCHMELVRTLRDLLSKGPEGLASPALSGGTMDVNDAIAVRQV
jgi:hypothetical protein